MRSGLTPVVFIITGFFFFCTAASYAEATAMFPEAGGSSSFARRAFNEFWSFFAAWAGMLTYTVTIAISAFFVPHYIGGVFAFADALRTSPGDIVGRREWSSRCSPRSTCSARRSRPGST